MIDDAGPDSSEIDYWSLGVSVRIISKYHSYTARIAPTRAGPAPVKARNVSAKLAELLLLLHHADALISDRSNDSRHCEDAADDRTQLRDDMSVRIKC